MADTAISNEFVIPLSDGRNVSLSMAADGWVKITSPNGTIIKEKPDDFVRSFLS